MDKADVVILLVRMWVEIALALLAVKSALVILLVRMWVEMRRMGVLSTSEESSSSWGCELKFYFTVSCICWVRSSSSWGCELKCKRGSHRIFHWCHPPREDVSWNALYNALCLIWSRHPPREDVSWNMWVLMDRATPIRHPPREDVSWNFDEYIDKYGEEVILLVRMWVEIHHIFR